MSNARNLADVITGNFDVPLGALDNVPPSNDASALTTGTLDISRISNGSIIADKLASGAISEVSIPPPLTLWTYGNAPPNGQFGANFSLTEAQAPIGSFVILSVQIAAGSSAGDQYCYLTQNTRDFKLYTFVEGWYWYTDIMGLFYIGNSADRDFNISHGTIASSTNSDARRVRYNGYLKVTQ